MITPNMNLTLPVPTVTLGPQYAFENNTAFEVIDEHDHTPGAGVPITPDAININADLPFGNFNATNLRSSRYTPALSPLSLPSDLGCVYVSGVDLYYNDVSGNQIRLTQAGSIISGGGNITGLVAPASASYVSLNGTFVWQSNTNVAANLDAASVILRNTTVSSFGLTLSPPTLAGNFTITLPTLPGSGTKFLRINNTGTMTANGDVDNVTIEVVSNNLQVKNLGITVGKLAANIPVANPATIGLIAESASLNKIVGLTPEVITGSSVTITVSGNRAILYEGMLTSTSGGGQGIIILAANRVFCSARVGGVPFASIIIPANSQGNPLTILRYIYYPPSAGTYTFDLEAFNDGNTPSNFDGGRMLAREI